MRDHVSRITGSVRSFSRIQLFVLAVLSLSILPSSSARANDDAISDAIDAGVEYLLAQVKANQVGAHHHGQTALETYALIVAGVDVDHPLIRKNLEFLNKSVPGGGTKHPTYTLACYIFMLDAAIAQKEQDLLMLAPKKLRKQFRDDPRIGREFRGHLKTAVQNLAKLQLKKGGWDYAAPKERFDNSNTQFAVLGLGVGAKRGVPLDPDVWTRIMDHFVGGQMKNGPETKDRITLMTPTDIEEWQSGLTIKKESTKKKSSGRGRGDKSKKEGDSKKGSTVVVVPPNPEVGFEGIKVFRRGWDYTNGGKATWNMTCAGLSSLILARENLRKRLTAEQRNALNKSINDGYGWIMGHWTPNHSYYGAYSLEKVGDLGGVKLFKDRDWFKELSGYLVNAQQDDGSWPGGGAHGEKNNPRVASSFALLILNRASSLITRNPQSNIVVSGRSGGGDGTDRSWVYVPELDSTVHYPSLMRQIRMRPSAKLLKFLQNIVDSYPPEYKGELIPDMARMRDSIRSKSARGLIEKYLTSITGVNYEDPEKYLKWHRRWERVRLIGDKRSKENIPDLLKYYKSTSQSATLKQTVMWAFVQCRAREALPLLVADLEASDAVVRQAAYNSMRTFFTDFPPAFTPKAKGSVREKQVAAIRAWYDKQMARSGAARAGG